MCDKNSRFEECSCTNSAKNNEGEEDMSTPAMKPMEVKFPNKKKEKEFIDWAEGKKSQHPPNIMKTREGVKKAREMRKRGKFNF